MDASTLIDLALSLLGLTTSPSDTLLNDETDPGRTTKPIG
jgi:hypothetical protein